jgi:2-polyprenyl-3-methyl-5-hydroxy-6-metoxy-1,4-benzoquinol methylase
MTDLHVYRRELTGTEGESLAHVASLIEAPGAVLDVGTGCGALGRHLAASGRVVDGVTHNPQEAELARPHYRQVLVADLCAPGALHALGGRRYRYVVCADVLEHLPDPVPVLARLVALLDDEGELIVSLPNVGYAGLVAGLMAGEFRYRDEGLLDRTHLRFFTRASLVELLADAGLAVNRWHPVVRPVPRSEFAVHWLDMLPPVVTRHLLGAPDAGVYQFVARAGKKPIPGDPQSPFVRAAVRPQFSAQVYFGEVVPGRFDEARSAHALGEIGVTGQVLRFDWPAGLGWVSRVRLDPADRPGFLRIGTVSIRDADGHTLWSTRPTVADWRACAGMVPVPLAHDRSGLQLALISDDPHGVLDLPENLPGHPAALEVEVDWPYAAEAVPLAVRLGESEARLAQTMDQMASLEARYQQALADHAREVAALQAGHEAHISALHQDVAARDALLRETFTARDALAERLAHAERLLDAVRNSKIWRLARRLRLTRIVL